MLASGLVGIVSLCACERDSFVLRGELPVGFCLEGVDLFLPADKQGKGRGLHSPDGQDAAFTAVAEGVEPCCVHAKEPVARCPGDACIVEVVVLLLVSEVPEAVTDGLFCQGGDPEPLDGTADFGQLHDPSLDELSFLSCITAVDDGVGLGEELLDDAELFLDACLWDELDAEAWWHHRQLRQRPGFPGLGVVARFLQRTQVTEGPRHLIAVTFHIAVMGAVGSQDARNIPSYTRFLSDTYNHIGWQKY